MKLASLIVICAMGVLASSARAACSYKVPQIGTEVRPGFIEWMDRARLTPLKDKLPDVSDPELAAILHSPDTMWYDDHSMIFGYQDSIDPDPQSTVGFRAQCVGRAVGENPPVPIVGNLKNYFGPDYKFVFPFRKAAGTDKVNVANEIVINFWSPPVVGGSRLPVKYWRKGPRDHYYWTFPHGTVFGEILFQRGHDGVFYPYEIRTRKRYQDGWAVNLFRPFTSATALAAAIKERRPGWDQSANLRSVIAHLENPATLVPHSLSSPAFASVFPAIQGALDPIPNIDDKTLVVELLTRTPFTSTEGKVWKKNGQLETYAPSSRGEFSIVPKDYEGGMLAVNEVSCMRCHNEVARKIKHFDKNVMLYGEIWGEDRIFTWHPFEPNRYIYATFDESETPATRRFNPRLIQAGLIKNEKPSAGDPYYKPLSSAFDLD